VESQDQAPAPRAKRRPPWRWIILGVVAFLIVAGIVVGAGSYWWFAEKVKTANDRTTPAVSSALEAKPSTTLVSVPPSSQPQSSKAVNIILLGSENTGTATQTPGRSSTIMVLHVDPGLDFACLLSVPRDLYVDIPGHGKNRINQAYILGGPQLTIQTVKQVLGLDITKYVEVDFDAFGKLIDSLGGVYVDVDRRYQGTESFPIDLNPGYQLLNGARALAFARYRFDQNGDSGRMTRQQRVLAAVREQAIGWDLPMKLPGIVGSVLDATATNLSTNEILQLALWLAKVDGERTRQIVITAPQQMIAGKTVLVADAETLKKAVTDLLTAPPAEGAGSTGTAESPTTATSAATTTTATSAAAVSESEMWKTAQKAVPFLLEAPGFIPAGFAYTAKMPPADGTYQVNPGGGSKPAVRMLYRYGTKDLYMGITATTWTDAPAAGNGLEVVANGVTYTVVGTSGKVDRIWWKKDGVLYFISNTLMYDASKADLLKMAQSMAPVGTGK
jgi:polyisoprenyl-teichoic acid--peptidoglycan teichoic acid transferase